MTFYYITSLDDLSEGMYGIMEPDERYTADVYNINSICIVPGLAFDLKGYRLGYGKGYYDRFLKDFNGVSVSPCYDSMLEDEIPTDKYDIQINIIVTDKEVIQWINFQTDFPTILMKTF